MNIPIPILMSPLICQGGASSPDTTPDGKQAILVIGDSHLLSSSGTSSSPDVGAGIMYEYNNGTNSLVEITTGEISTGNDGSMWNQFAIDYNAATGYKPVICTSAEGGTSYAPDGSGNDWSNTGTIYAPMVTKANNCLTKLNLSKFKAIVISLGSADIQGATALGTIQTAVASLYTRLSSNFPGTKILIISPGRIGAAVLTDARRFGLKKYTLQSTIDFLLAETCSNAYSYSSWGLLQGDNIHLTQAGYNKMGSQVARSLSSTSSVKEIRQVFSLFFDELSENSKSAYTTFINSIKTMGAYDLLDTLQIYRALSANNTRIDLLNLTGLAIGGTPTFVANDCITTSTNNYYNTNWNPLLSQFHSTTTDILVGWKTGTSTTPAGTGAYGIGALSGSDGLRCFQTSSNTLSFAVNSGTLTGYTGHTKFQNNTRYALARDAGNQHLIVNGAIVQTGAVAATTAPNAAVTVGGLNNGGSVGTFIASQFQYFYAAKYTGFPQVLFEAAVETLLTSLSLG